MAIPRATLMQQWEKQQEELRLLMEPVERYIDNQLASVFEPGTEVRFDWYEIRRNFPKSSSYSDKELQQFLVRRYQAAGYEVKGQSALTISM